MEENSKVQTQLNIAKKIMEYLLEQRYINSCKIHGSLSGEICDKYSDIDLQVDVSGYDNGKMVLMLPYILQRHFSQR
jgi:predicted nucleotidyltransferase